MWSIYKLNENLALTPNGESASLRSCVFELQDSSMWMLELRTARADFFSAHLVIHSIPRVNEAVKARKL
jgi:hypothetical protein